MTGPSFSLDLSTNKIDRHDIAYILLKVALNSITLNPNDIERNSISVIYR